MFRQTVCLNISQATKAPINIARRTMTSVISIISTVLFITRLLYITTNIITAKHDKYCTKKRRIKTFYTNKAQTSFRKPQSVRKS